MELNIKGLNKDQKNLVYSIDEPLIVGRSRSCDIFIMDVRASRQQARFFRNNNGALCLEDLGSLNGSFVNGQQIERAILKEGDVVRLGSTDFLVQKRDGSTVKVIDSDMYQKTKIVKQMTHLSIPSLETMHAQDYFKAIGVTEEIKPLKHDLSKLQRQTKNFATLFEISKALQREEKMADMCRSVLDLLLKVPGGDIAYVVMVDEKGTLKPRAARDLNGNTPKQFVLSKTVSKYVLQEQCGVLAPDVQNDARFSSSQSIIFNQTSSILAAPIIIEGKSRGILALLANDTDIDIQEEDLELLCVVAGLMARTIQNLELQEQREKYLRELEAANRKILNTQEQLLKSEKMAAIGRLSSGVIHEVKNHLSPLMLADFVAEQYPDDEDIQEMTEMVIEARSRILDLVDEIRMFARGDTREYNMLPHVMSEVVQRVVRFVSCDAKVRRSNIKYTCIEDAQVIMDAERIRQVLINLLQNAADALQNTENPQIRVRVFVKMSYSCVSVTDNGVGIPQELQSKIFDPLFTTKGENGLGLGLDICKRLVRAHKGELICSSQLNKGTTFTMMIPLNHEDAEFTTTM